MIFMAEIHRDKNGNPMRGATKTSHIIYTHDGGLEAHDAAIFQAGVRVGMRKGVQEYMDARHTARKKSQSRHILQKLIKK